MLITLDNIRQAAERIAGIARHTPLIPYHDDNADVWLKPESFQPIGSFKIRGAFNRLAALSEAERANGVIAYSSGNHAQGVAFAARHFGVKAVIVMPSNTPSVKLEATRSYGAEIVIYDAVSESREEVAARLMQGRSMTLVPPYNDPYIIAGQGTIGLEIAADLPDVDLVLAPVGGGGLLSGVATALKSLKPDVKVIGVEPELAADAQASLRSGKIVAISPADANRTIADGTRTLALGDLTFEHARYYSDGIVTVSEDDIGAAVRDLLLKSRLVIEPSGALTMAAWLFRRAELPPARRVALILSGGNIDPAVLIDILK